MGFESERCRGHAGILSELSSGFPCQSYNVRVRAVYIGVVTVGFALWLSMSIGPESTLAEFSTPSLGRAASQTHNAWLALSKLNGVEIPAGGEFSFNKWAGPWSRDAGYRKAPVSFNGQLIADWGGGVCQASTAVYNAALLAGMEIVERHRHVHAPSYVPPGRDAAVAYSSVDLRFRNPYPFTVRLLTDRDANSLRIRIVGRGTIREPIQVREEVLRVASPREYIVGSGGQSVRVRNSGRSGFEARVWRIRGDRQELVSRDVYPVVDRIVERR
jgi:vancomycin resistance protein YoaR